MRGPSFHRPVFDGIRPYAICWVKSSRDYSTADEQEGTSARIPQLMRSPYYVRVVEFFYDVTRDKLLS